MTESGWKKIKIVAAAGGIVLAAIGMSACGDSSVSGAVGSSAAQTVADQHPSGAMGSALTIRTNDPSNYGVGVQKWTVAAPTDNLVVRVVITQVEGSVGPGNITALTDAGNRLDPAYPGTTLSTAGFPAQGEIRRGVVAFDVPAGEHVTKILVDQAYNIVAEWEL